MSRLLEGLRARSHLASGLIDSGLASAATFIVGVYAVRVLPPTVLGAYALAFSAVFLAGILPANLVFAPVEVDVVKHPAGERLRYLPRSLLLGLVPALLGGAVALGWVLLAPEEVPEGAVLPLMVTGSVTAIASPIQDHVRRMLHSGGASHLAAVVSGVQICAVIGALVAGGLAGVSEPWLPLGALGSANVVSLLSGIVLGIRRRGSGPVGKVAVGQLVRSGAWIFTSGALSPAAGFIAAALLANLASAAALGYAEAARIVGQPVWVLAVGLSSALAPHSMAAAKAGDRVSARRVSRQFNGLIVWAGVVCLALFGFPWWWNPFHWLMPSAYAITGLVSVTIVTQVLIGVAFPLRSEVLGGGREASLVGVEAVGSLGRIGVAGLAGVLQAFALPLGHALQGGVRGVGCWWLLRRVYAEEGRAEARETP